MSGAEVLKHDKPKEVDMNGKTKLTYKKRTGVAGAHGQFMEINLLTLFKLQGDKRLQDFYLAGNCESAGDFDDIVFRYVDGNDSQNVIFLQAKSKATNTKVGFEIFKADGMFDLQKHFMSYLKIHDEFQKSPDGCPIFSGNDDNLNCHFVMYTNAIRDESMTEHVDEMEEHPLSIVMGQMSGHAFKLKAEAVTQILRQTQTADEIEKIVTLLKALSNTDCKNLQRDENFKMYHAFLTQTILVKVGSAWRFRSKFVEGALKNEAHAKLREQTLCWLSESKLGKSNDKKTRNDAVKKLLNSHEFKLPDWFENELNFDKELCDEFIKIATPCISGNICIITKMNKKLMNKVAKLAGNVFVFDENTAMFKFNEHTLDAEPRKVFDYLSHNLKMDHTEPRLMFDFRIDKFPRLSLGYTKIDPKIAEFVSKLTIMTDQPGVDGLEKLIKENLGNASDGELTRRYLQTKEKVAKWWEQSMDTTYLRKDDKFFEGILCGIHFGLKDPIKSFTGRDVELKKLHNGLQNNGGGSKTTVASQMATICGLGGIGKSELARKYAYKFGESYDGNVIWIDAETYNTMTDSFHKVCKDCLNIPTQNADKEVMEISTIVQNVYSVFRHRKCLFIFDNATQFKNDRNGNHAIMPFLPDLQQGINPHFVITSRNQNWPCDISIQLNVFKDAEAEQLVKTSLGIQEGQHANDVKALLQQLGNFPLAMQQALAYIRQMDKKYKKAAGKLFQISDYLKVYQLQTKDLLDFEFPSDCNDMYTKTTFMTWNITLAAIEKDKLGKEAREIVNIMAYLNPNDIPTTFFREVVYNSEGKLIQVFNLIEGYSMITLHDGKANIHRLVQSVTRINLQGPKQQIILRKTLLLVRNHTDNNLIVLGASVWNYANHYHNLVKEFHTVPLKIIIGLNATFRYENATVFGKTSINSLKRVIGGEHPTTLTTERNIAETLSYQGKYKEALCCYKEVLEKQTQILGPYNPSTLITQQNVANSLAGQGNYEEALYYNKDVLQKQVNMLGPDNPSTLTTQNNIAKTISMQGKYEDARCLYTDVLQKKKIILGPDNLSTLSTQQEVAETLSYQGKYEEALCLYKEVLQNKIKTVGLGNQSTLTTQYHIAKTMFYQGKYKEALHSYKEVLEKQTQILGPDNPITLNTQHDVAKTLSHQGKYEEALCHYKEVLEKEIKILGPENPSTLNTQHNIALTLSNQGRIEEALCLYKEVLHKKIEIMGPDNPSSLITQYNVAEILSMLGKHEEALCCYGEVLVKQRKILGANNPSTIHTEHNVAQTLSRQGKHEEALCSYKEVLEKQIKILGPENPSTLTTQHNVAKTLYNQGKYEKALCYYNEVLEKLIRILGPEHPHTLDTEYDVAITLYSQGKYEEALCSFKEVLEKQIKILGPDHLSTLTTKHNFAKTLYNQGKYEKALCYYTEVFEKLIRILGPEHPHTLDTEYDVAITLYNQGKYEEALCSYKEVLEKQIKILGPDHPDTLTTQHNFAKTLSNQGKYEEALCSYREVLEKRIRILGPEHPLTLTTQHDVAQTLSNQGKYEEALCSYKEVLEKQIKILGLDHPDTLTTQHDVAQTLSNQGKYEEALCSYREVLEKRIKILGKNNLSTFITLYYILQILLSQKQKANDRNSK